MLRCCSEKQIAVKRMRITMEDLTSRLSHGHLWHGFT